MIYFQFCIFRYNSTKIDVQLSYMQHIFLGPEQKTIAYENCNSSVAVNKQMRHMQQNVQQPSQTYQA